MKQTIAVALSGGIDSLTTAFLLKEAGYKVLGIHFVTGYEVQNFKKLNQISIPTKIFPDNENAVARALSSITEKIQIPLKIIDINSDFTKNVVEYFCRTYQNGETPNPCLVCNPSIKFGTVLNVALAMGASRLATGHYVRVKKDRNNIFHLLKGIDKWGEWDISGILYKLEEYNGWGYRQYHPHVKLAPRESRALFHHLPTHRDWLEIHGSP